MKFSTLLVTGLVTLTGVMAGEAQAIEKCRNIYRTATSDTVCVRDNGERTNVGGYLATLGDSRPMSDYGRSNPVVESVQNHLEQEGRRMFNETFQCMMTNTCGGQTQSFSTQQQYDPNPFAAQHEIVRQEFDGTRYQCKNAMGHTVRYQYGSCF